MFDAKTRTAKKSPAPKPKSVADPVASSEAGRLSFQLSTQVPITSSEGRGVGGAGGAAASGAGEITGPGKADTGVNESLAAESSAITPRAIREQLGEGTPLEGGLRSRMEQGLGYPFSSVRVHTGETAAKLAWSLSARAFTVGSDIAFAPGEFRPGSLGGDALVAHELAHVAQQEHAAAAAPLRAPLRGAAEMRGDSAAFEAEAERAAAGALMKNPLYHAALDRVATPQGARRFPEAHALVRQAALSGPRLRSGLQIQKQDKPTPLTQLDPTYAGAIRPGETPAKSGDIYLDLDGDQSADYIVNLSLTDTGTTKFPKGYIGGDREEQAISPQPLDAGPGGTLRIVPGPTSPGSPLNNVARLRIELKRINPAHTSVIDYYVRKPASEKFLPPTKITGTDGVRPVVIQLSDSGGSVLHIFPPWTREKDVLVETDIEWSAQLGGGVTSLTPALPLPLPGAKNPPKKFTVFHAGTPRHVGGMWALDFTVGAFGDPVRMTFFKNDPNSKEVLIGFVPMADGKPISGRSYTLKGAPAKPLNVRVLSGSNIELLLDLDGDGGPDMSVVDFLEAKEEEGKYDLGPPYDVSKNRQHNFMLRLGRIAFDAQRIPSFNSDEEVMVSLRISGGHYSLYGGGGQSSFAVSSQAVAVDTLPEQAAKGDYAKQVANAEGERNYYRKLAHDKQLIPDDLYNSWTALSDSLVNLQIAKGKNDPATARLQTETADKALTYYAVIARLTKDVKANVQTRASHVAVQQSWDNPYTGTSTTETSGIGQQTTPANAQVLSNVLRGGNLDAAFHWYHQTASGFDAWIVKRLRDANKDSPEAKRLENLVYLDKQLQDMAKYKVTPVYAIFHQLHAFEEHLTIDEFPLSLYYWDDGSDWHLRDITNPAKIFETTLAKDTAQTEPPHELFLTMNRAAHFVKGYVHYQLPGGRVGRVEMTEDKEWSDYFAYAAAALGAAAFILATAGAGSIVVTACIVAASAAGAISAGLDIKEKSEQGILDAYDVIVDVAQIAAALLGGAGQVLREIKLAQQAFIAAQDVSKLSRSAQLLAQWGTAARFYRPITIAAIGADVVNLLVFAPKVKEDLAAIDAAPGSEGDKLKSKALLIGRFFGQGLLTIVSLRGSWKELQSLGSWEIGLAGGRPVARVPAGTYAHQDYQDELNLLLKGTAAEKAKVEVEVLSGEKFKARFESASGDAVVAFENNKPKVYVREGAVKAAIYEEVMHIHQARDPHFGPLMRMLDEAKLAQWATLSSAEKLTLVRAKLELEIDAQKRIIREISSRTSASKEEYVQLDNAWQNLEHLRGKFGEWAGLEAELSKTKALAGDPELLKQPPRLFNKPTTASFDLMDVWKNMKPDEFVAAYRAKYPDTTLSETELLQRYADGQRLNPDTWRLYSPTRRAETEPDVKARYTSDPTTYSTGTTTPPGSKPLALSEALEKERKLLLAERDAARVERDTHLKKVPPDEALAGKASYKVNEASRKLGEMHAEAYMGQHHPDYVKVYPPAGAGSRSGDFDQVWQRTKTSATGEKEFVMEHIVIEAKGGSSPLGARQAGPIRAQQGTPEYFQSIIDSMKKGTPQMQDAALKLQAAGVGGVHYLHVKVPIESGATSDVTTVITREFDLTPPPPTVVTPGAVTTPATTIPATK
jgi:hypothetical protein